MNKRVLGILFLIVATELIGFGLIIPVLPQIAMRFEANVYLVGILMAAYSFAQFFAAPFLGAWSDQIGRRPVLLLSKMGTVISYLILAFSHSFWLFLLARLLDGFTGGNISVARAYIIDVTSHKDRARGMAVIGMGFGVGFLLGPALGGLLYGSALGHMIPSFVAAFLSLLAYFLTLFFLKEPEKKVKTDHQVGGFLKGFLVIKQKSVLFLLGLYFLYMLVFSGFETTFAVYMFKLFDFSVKQNSLLFMYAGLLAVLIQGGIIRRSSKRFKWATCFGLIALSVAFLGMGLMQHWIYILFFMAFLALGVGVINAYLPALLSLFIPDHLQGVVMGVYEGMGSLSRILGPLLAFVYVVDFPRFGYLSFSIILFLLSLFLLGFMRYQKE